MPSCRCSAGNNARVGRFVQGLRFYANRRPDRRPLPDMETFMQR